MCGKILKNKINYNYKFKAVDNCAKMQESTVFLGCILNPGHGKIPAPDFNFYTQKDKYPI